MEIQKLRDRHLHLLSIKALHFSMRQRERERETGKERHNWNGGMGI